MGNAAPRGAASDSRLRNEPVQARSSARLSALLDAAAQLVDEVGYERITTAMVADKAGASIGTVYRYFPDRIAVLQGLADRAMSRFLEHLDERFDAEEPTTLHRRVELIVDALAHFYRTEPGYRVIRFGDAIDERVADGMDTVDGELAGALGRVLRARDRSLASDDLDFRIQVAMAICEVLVHRAFAAHPDGDARFLAEAKQVAGDYLAATVLAVD